MSEHSPTPWRVVDLRSRGNCTVDIYDATGHRVFMWAKVTPTDAADLNLIIEAVNGVEATRELQRKLLGWSMERDRLRDIVRRLADALDTFSAIEDHEIDLLREAREALGEAQP